MNLSGVQGSNEEENRDIAFQAVAAIRDTIFIASRKQQPPTYEQSLRFVYDLDEDLYKDFIRLLTEKNDSEIVKLCKEEAIIQGRDLIDIIEENIEKYQKLEIAGKAKGEQTGYIKNKLIQYYAAKENIKPRSVNENAVLHRDFSNVDRQDIFGEKFFIDDKFVDYTLTRGRFLRLRLLHPDQGERLTGADLVYEQYDQAAQKVRLLFLQYKTWIDGSLYFNQNQSLLPQMQKLKANLCDKKYCNKHDSTESIEYRFPYCCAFLRPTDKLQHKESKMISSGLHIPICNALKYASTSSKITKQEIRHTSLSHHFFERLFSQNLIGSRWLDIDEVEAFYKEKKILEPDEKLKLYAREIIDTRKKEWKETQNDEVPF